MAHCMIGVAGSTGYGGWIRIAQTHLEFRLALTQVVLAFGWVGLLLLLSKPGHVHAPRRPGPEPQVLFYPQRFEMFARHSKH